MPDDAWHYIRGEQQFGPVPFQVLQNLARSGDVSPQDLIWSDGMPDWVPAESIQGLLSPRRTPRARGSGNRPRGARRTGARPASRRPGRALGRAAQAPTAATSPPTQRTRDRTERQRGRRTSSLPGPVLAAAICDFLVWGLTSFAGFMGLRDAEQYRRLARQQTDQQLTNLHWNNGNIAEDVALVAFIIAGVFVALALALLTRRRWSPAAQTILSLLAAVPLLIGLGQDPGTPQVVGADQTAHQLFIVVLAFLIAPMCCVWSPRARSWVTDQTSGHRGPGQSPPRRRWYRGRRNPWGGGCLHAPL